MSPLESTCANPQSIITESNAVKYQERERERERGVIVLNNDIAIF